jgi:tRNA (mo5U34)-methyltransferase
MASTIEPTSAQDVSDSNSRPYYKKLVEGVSEFEDWLRNFKEKEHTSFRWYPWRTLLTLARIPNVLAPEYDHIFDSSRRYADIGAADGDLAFYLEAQGNQCDIYDYGPTNMNGLQGANYLKEKLSSKVRIFNVDLDSQFEMDGIYDVIFFLGILYHLKNPMLVLEQLTKHSQFIFCMTKIARYFSASSTADMSAHSAAYLVDTHECNNDPTNFWIFTEMGFRRVLDRCGWEILGYWSNDVVSSNPQDPDRDERAMVFARNRNFQVRSRGRGRVRQSLAGLSDMDSVRGVTEPILGENFPARLARAEAASDAKEWRRAAELWDELRADFPHDPQCWYRAGRAYCELGMLDQAERILDEAIALFPDNERAAYWHVIVARRRADWSEALKRAEKMRQAFPASWSPWIEAADALRGLGHLVESEEKRREALKRFPDEFWTNIGVARLEAERGSPAEAIRIWSELVARFPDQPDAAAALQAAREAARHPLRQQSSTLLSPRSPAAGGAGRSEDPTQRSRGFPWRRRGGAEG